ncbi:hypothetical protein OKW76_01835 [Sphingomonas sp. S1-29]|nr:hypothetical protein [Sphingomonas sp. S1-29]UZK70956.1 hypothetical protein OKW76_01835 [Sphingomonas sp. S1-29]
MLLAFLPAPQQTVPATPPSASCEYDDSLLTLSFDAFDQDPKGGWRALAERPGCEEAAADLIYHYRFRMAQLIPLMTWHEAQLRAQAGADAGAIELMRQSRKPDDADPTGWNPYVDATIAFLRKDKPAFLAARERLRVLPKPVDQPKERAWPPNGHVIERLWKCFDQSYEVAYSSAC